MGTYEDDVIPYPGHFSTPNNGNRFPEDVQVYVIKTTKGHNGNREIWAFTTRKQMVRSDAPAFCGTLPEVHQQIAQAEGVSVGMLEDQGRSHVEVKATSEHLEEALAYTKETGKTISTHIYRTLDYLKTHLPGRKVEYVGDDYVVDNQWVVGHSIRYAPADTVQLKEEYAQQLKLEKDTPKRRKGPKNSKLPKDMALRPMFNAIREALGRLEPFKTSLGRAVHYVELHVCYINWARSRYEHALAIPRLVALYHKMSFSRAYRTGPWIRGVKILASQYMDDPLMKGALKKMILAEDKECRMRKKKPKTTALKK